MAKKLLQIMTSALLALSVLPLVVTAEEPEGMAEETAKQSNEIQTPETNAVNEERSSEGEAYAVITESGDLIFFRSRETYANDTSGAFTDLKGNTYKGTVFAGFETFTNEEGRYRFDMVAPWHERRGDISAVRVADGQKISPLTMEGWFNHCYMLESFDGYGMDTSKVTDMSWMFSECGRLKTLDLTPFDTGSVTDLSYMFDNCSIRSVDLSSFDTSNVINMYCMFDRCEYLEELDLNSFDTSNTVTMAGMFSDCVALKKLNISSFNTSKVQSFDNTFAYCLELTELDVSHFDTSSATNMFEMFKSCMSLSHLDVSGFDTGNVISMGRMFANAWRIEELDVSGFDTHNADGLYGMFFGCSSLSDLDVSHFDLSSATAVSEMFSGCSGLRKLDLSSFDLSHITSMNDMFKGMDSLREVKLGKGFASWKEQTYLTAGSWKHAGSGKTLSEKQLYEQYPKNVSSYAGTWQRQKCVTGITFDRNELTLVFGEKYQLKVTVTPSDAENQKILWTSSDVLIGSGENGRISANETAGRITVTAMTYDGHFKAVCNVLFLFKDVADQSKYFFEPVYWALDHAITKGAGGAGKFSPNDPCTREQIVTFLWRLAGEPVPKTRTSFTDVKKSDWYFQPIMWAAENNITLGLNDGTGRFGVGQPCTREQCVTFLHRAAGKPEVGAHISFTDVSEDRYFYDAVSWAASQGITVGLNDGTGRFGAGQKCTRAMIVTFLHRYAEKIGMN